MSKEIERHNAIVEELRVEVMKAIRCSNAGRDKFTMPFAKC